MRYEICKVWTYLFCVAFTSSGYVISADPVPQHIITYGRESWVASRQGFGFTPDDKHIYARHLKSNNTEGTLSVWTVNGQFVTEAIVAQNDQKSYFGKQSAALPHPDGKGLLYYQKDELRSLMFPSETQKNALDLTNQGYSYYLPDIAVMGTDKSTIWLANTQYDQFHVRKSTLDSPTTKIHITWLPSEVKGKEISLRTSTLNGAVPSAAIAAKCEGDNSFIQWWNLNDKKSSMLELPTNVGPSSIIMTDDGKYAIVGFQDSSICFCDLEQKTSSKKIMLGNFTVGSLAIDPSGKYVACGTYDGDGKPNMFLVSLVTGKVIEKWCTEPKNSVIATAFSHKGAWLAALGHHGKIHIYDFEDMVKNFK